MVQGLLYRRVRFTHVHVPVYVLPLEGCMAEIIAWVVLGLIAGAIAKAVMPGKDPGGIVVTILIGIVGAFVGGFIGRAVLGRNVDGFNFASIALAVLGSVLLLWIYRMATRGRTTTP